MKLTQLKNFLDQYFSQDLIAKAREIDEHMPNGLQWQGKDEIKKLVLGVSASEALFKKAVAKKADAILTHHGLQIDIIYNLFSPSLQKRLAVLVENDLSLFAFHYLLDSHPVIGNNAVIIRELGAKKTDQTIFDGWGWIGEFDKPVSPETIEKKCRKLFSREIRPILADKNDVKRIGVVSGRGVPFPAQKRELFEKEIELYISGEISEWNVREFEELGINYFACGHYATEIFGVQELGKKIKEKFGNKLEVEFIDIPNPV